MGVFAVKLFFSKATLRSPVNGSLNEPHGLLPEPLFLRALCLERKRAERSRKLFVLMLIEPGKPLQNADRDDLLDRTVTAIGSSIRETDVAGWYKESSALGVIFAELGAADSQTVIGALRAKVTVEIGRAHV